MIVSAPQSRSLLSRASPAGSSKDKLYRQEESGMRIYPREKRSVKNGGTETREQIRPQVSIHEKPPSIVTKGFYGNREGDLILSKDHPVCLINPSETQVPIHPYLSLGK